MCLRIRSSSPNPRISPLTEEYAYNGLSLFAIVITRQPQLSCSDIRFTFHANVCDAYAFNEHPDFLKVYKVVCSDALNNHNYRPIQPYTHPMSGPVGMDRCTTTSILTTSALIYAIGAGITAAAGTRLALQLNSCIRLS